jgi:branched-chain amino acid transport system ATP-binding protein
MSILALKNVSKSFGALKVTDDVSFEVPEGRRWASSGPMARASRRCSI